MTISISRQAFFEAILRAFDENETKTLCSIALGVDYDDLPGNGLAAKQRELILYFERREQNGALISAVTAQRPNIIKINTGKLGALLRVNNEMPDPESHRPAFLAAMGQRSVGGEYFNKIILALLMLVAILQAIIIAMVV